MFIQKSLILMSLFLARIGHVSAFSFGFVVPVRKTEPSKLCYSSCRIISARSRRSPLRMLPFLLPDSFPFSSLFGSDVEEVDPGIVEGTDLYVRKYPHPCLRAENADVTMEEISSGEIAKLSKDMFKVMYATIGCGLAAPQVGINKRLMVYNVSGDPKRWLDEIVMINPKIVEYSEGKDIENEGCLSFPKLRGDVERSKWIKVEALNLKGKPIKKKFVGWDARVFQHEYDHLDGIVFTDRMTEISKAAAKGQLDQWIADFGENGAI